MAIDFSGGTKASNYVLATVSGVSGPVYPCTLAFRIRVPSFASFPSGAAILFGASPGPGSDAFGVWFETNGVPAAESKNTASPISVDGTSGLSTNTWHHVALVATSASAGTQYLNGVANGTWSTLNIPAVAPTGLLIGGWDGGDTGYLTQDLAFWNVALTAAEVLQAYGARNDIKRSSMLGWYPLHGGGSPYVDQSGNGRTLTTGGTVSEATVHAPVSWGAPAYMRALSVASGTTSISATGANSSAGSGTLSGGAISGTGAVSSAATGTLSRAVAIAAAGGTASAGALDLYVAGGMPSRFQGSAQYTLAVSLAGTQQHTLMAWARSDATTPDNTVVHLTNATDSDSSRIGFVDVSGTHEAVFVQHRTGIGSTAYLPVITYSAWHHLAIVVDGTNQVSYIDGTQVDSRAFDPSLRSTAFSIIRIGDQFTANTEDCSIQDVQVYTAALTAAEIRTAQHGTVPPAQASNLYARWMLQRNAPTQDTSGNARHLSTTGTITGSSFAPLYGPDAGAQSAASGTLGAGSISGTGAIQSAATGALQNRLSATGAVSSAGTASFTVAASLTAAGGVTSAGTAGTSLLLSATGGIASAASGTATEAVAVAATGAIASAATTPLTVAASLTATGAIQSAASGAMLRSQLLTAAGGIASAGTGTATEAVALAGTGAISSAASAPVSTLTGITAAGGVASAASTTATAAVALSGTGGVLSAGTAAFTVAASLTAAGGVTSAGTASVTGGGGIAATGAMQSAGTAGLTVAALQTGTGAVSSASSAALSVKYAIAAAGGITSAASATPTALTALAGTGAVQSAATATATRGLALAGTGALSSAAAGSTLRAAAMQATGAMQLAAAGALTVGALLSASGASASAAAGTLSVTGAVVPAPAIVSGWVDGGDVTDTTAHGKWYAEVDATGPAHGIWQAEAGPEAAAHTAWIEEPVSGGTARTWIAAVGGSRSASSATLTVGQVQPTLATTLGGGAYTLAKDWNFGTAGNVGTAAQLNADFTYHDPFNTITNGTNYGALMVRAPGADTFGVYNYADIGLPNDQQPEDPGTRYRSFTSNSMVCNVKPLDTASTVVGPASAHNAGCGSFVSKLTYSAGGTRLGQTIVWETRCRVVSAPNGYWFALWLVGPQWDGGPEIDLVEAFSSVSPNVNADLFNSNGIGGTNSKNYFGGPWEDIISTLGISGYALPNGSQSLRNWHTFTLEYKSDNTFKCYMDSTLIQSGTLDWKVPTSSTVPTLQFLFDFGFGHTAISPINAAVISDINATPLTYEIAYSRIWTR